MPTLRQMVDGRTLETVKAASPAAKHVANHVQDPFGATKDGVDDLNKARMEYEVQKNNMRTQLAPVEAVVQGIKNMHQLDGPGDGSPLDMSPNNPANQPPQMLDQNGMVMGQPNLGQMTAPQGGINAPASAGSQIDESTGVPQNMEQSPGAKMNMNRPSLSGFQPGVSPGPAESVRPGKMGTPQPGQAKQSTVAGNPNPGNMPAGWTKPGSGGTGNQPGQYAPAAKPPQGNRSLPGAKGPGDPKVANRTKKAQGNSGSGRPIHVEVHADNMMTTPAMSKVASAAASDKLRSYGTSDGVRKEWESRRGTPADAGAAAAKRDNYVQKRMDQGISHTAIRKELGMDKGEYYKTYGQHIKSLTRDRLASGSVKSSAKPCPKCGKVHAAGVKACSGMKAFGMHKGTHKDMRDQPLAAVGTSEGVQKSWESRQRKQASELGSNVSVMTDDQRKALVDYMKRNPGQGGTYGHNDSAGYLDAGGPGSGRRPEGGPNKKEWGDKKPSFGELWERAVVKAREFSTGRRKKLAKTGAAMPGGGFPIVNREDLTNAKQAIGRAKNRTATIRHINERAKALGAPSFGSKKLAARMANLTQ
jgi:hypothetical protein